MALHVVPYARRYDSPYARRYRPGYWVPRYPTYIYMLGVMDLGTWVPRYPAYIYILGIRKPGYPGLLVEVIPDHFQLVLAPRIPAPVAADLDI